MELTAAVKRFALDLGFDLVGIAPIEPPATMEAFERWLAAGYAGEMGYMTYLVEERRDLRSLLPTAKSAVVVGLGYNQPVEQGDSVRLARYALGQDYPRVLRRKLNLLLEQIRAEAGPAVEGRAFAGTAPILERDLAARAGLGWFGKNTVLINRRLGSFFFLGELLLNVELTPDAATSNQCGTCTRCIEACPTDAIVEPYLVDARRCISYLTIEKRGGLPLELRTKIGAWLFGCETCQEACPWNTDAPFVHHAAMAWPDGWNAEEVFSGLLRLSGTREELSAMLRETPMSRPKLRGLIRNACLVAANLQRNDAVPALSRLLEYDSPTVREAAAWALEQLET